MTEREEAREEIAKAREEIAKVFYSLYLDHNGYYGYKWEDVPMDFKGKVHSYEYADQILNLSGIAVIDEDAELPDNKEWHKNAREFEAYCAGRNDMLNADWRKVIK